MYNICQHVWRQLRYSGPEIGIIIVDISVFETGLFCGINLWGGVEAVNILWLSFCYMT